VILVVHHQEDQVRAAIEGVEFVRQERPRGTGDALAAALALLEDGPVIVAAGDTPLLQASTIRRLLAEARGPATVASFQAADPTGYGRIVRDPLRIVEEAHCSPAERAITEVNSGLYVFEAGWLRERLPNLVAHPPKNELYLTDLIDSAARVVPDLPAEDFVGINDRAQLAEARMQVRRRINRALALSGVDLPDLDTVHVDADAVVLPGASLGLGAVIEGRSEIAGEVGPHAVLRNGWAAGQAL
jgi:bifunctional UDP-N-acetylglucosamine pyrophosphorylase/glucosamine-1-phosphate N-acetyltransferase